MKVITNKSGWLAAIGYVATLTTGCKTIVRENIISAIDTGVGATIAENKQTQLYELKAGYIRSQFYSIPTGKIVENSSTNNAMVTSTNGTTTNAQISNAANVTPQLVAGIRSKTSLGDILLGMEISESFAVGDIAVKSAAATAMYIANAKDPATAQAASDAVQGVDSGSATSTYITSTNHQQMAATLKDLLGKKLTSKPSKVGDKQFNVGDSAAEYAYALAAEKGDTLFNIENKPSRTADFKDIIDKLQAATKQP